MTHDEYTSDLMNEASKEQYSMLQEPSDKACLIAPPIARLSRVKYRDANWMP